MEVTGSQNKLAASVTQALSLGGFMGEYRLSASPPSDDDLRASPTNDELDAGLRMP